MEYQETREIKSRITVARAALFRERFIFHQDNSLKLRKEILKWYIWSIALFGAENLTLRKVDRKYLCPRKGKFCVAIAIGN